MSKRARGYFAGNIKIMTALTRTVKQRNKLINFLKTFIELDC
jgi:hypothetical protein